MFDIRYASSADLDRLNTEMRAWKAREPTQVPPQSDQNEDAPVPAPDGCEQLDLFPL